MAEGVLTSTLTITGNVNGRKVGMSSTMTIENIYDAGIAQPGDNEQAYSTIGMSEDKALTFEQNCPSYIFAVNRSPCETGIVALQNAATSAIYELVVPPGAFVILNEYANGAGILTLSTTITNTTLEGVSMVTADRLTESGFVIKLDGMVAFEAIS